jgi:hypothetical protein
VLPLSWGNNQHLPGNLPVAANHTAIPHIHTLPTSFANIHNSYIQQHALLAHLCRLLHAASLHCPGSDP